MQVYHQAPPKHAKTYDAWMKMLAAEEAYWRAQDRNHERRIGAAKRRMIEARQAWFAACHAAVVAEQKDGAQ